MSKQELVEGYLHGRISRRRFIKALCTFGISAVAATVYADSLGTAHAADHDDDDDKHHRHHRHHRHHHHDDDEYGGDDDDDD